MGWGLKKLLHLTNTWFKQQTFEDIVANSSIQGLFAVVEKAVDAASLSVLECSGTLVTNRGWDGTDDQTFTLPAAAEGLKFKFEVVKAATATADTYFDTEGSATKFYLDGTALTDGHRIWTESVAVGESIVFHTVSLDGTTWDWVADSINGLWMDKGS